MTNRTRTVHLTKEEAEIVTDVLSLVLNDPDWQELATASDEEWEALGVALSKIFIASQATREDA